MYCRSKGWKYHWEWYNTIFFRSLSFSLNCVIIAAFIFLSIDCWVYYNITTEVLVGEKGPVAGSEYLLKTLNRGGCHVVFIYSMEFITAYIVYQSAVFAYFINNIIIFSLYIRMYLNNPKFDHSSLYDRYKLLLINLSWTVVIFKLIFNCLYIHLTNLFKYLEYINDEEYINVINCNYNFIFFYKLSVFTVFFISFMIHFYFVERYKDFGTHKGVSEYYHKYGIMQYLRKIFYKLFIYFLCIEYKYQYRILISILIFGIIIII